MNIIGKRKIWYLVSAILIIPGIIAWIIWGLNFGIDFIGGTQIDVKFENNVTSEEIIKSLSSLNIGGLSVISSGDNNFIIKSELINDETHKKIGESLEKISPYSEQSFYTVGPTVSANATKKAIMAVIIASIAIVIYIAITFRKVPKPANSWRFGICAVLALIHDLVFVIGVFAILGHFYSVELDSLFVTALLTIMGFSVHDTIVVFDRIRENLRKHPEELFEKNVNTSILQTLNRSLNTTLTVLIVLATLYFLGGSSLKYFILALLVGIFIGTYSSIFVASPLLVSWQGLIDRFNKKKLS